MKGSKSWIESGDVFPGLGRRLIHRPDPIQLFEADRIPVFLGPTILAPMAVRIAPAQHPGGGAGKFGLTNVRRDVVNGQSDPAVARPVGIGGVYRIFLVKRKLSGRAAEPANNPANNIEREPSWRNASGINF